MPETAIDKNGNTVLWENEIRLSKGTEAAAPSRDFSRTE